MKYPIDVSMGGAIRLGKDVVCDGFLRECGTRVQSHVHVDHMRGFESSKGYQEIVMSEASRSLLLNERDADLPYRSNILGLQRGQVHQAGSSRIALLSSGHMLGAVQVAVETSGGLRLGYSGDFQWPLDEVMQVEALVLDSTYGGAGSIREYTQAEAESALLELVHSHVTRGPVYILAHRGTLQRALQILSENVQWPLVGSRNLCNEVEVYRRYGYGIGSLVQDDSDAGFEVSKGGRFIRLYGTGDQLPTDLGGGITIKLSAFFSRPDSPVLEYTERSFCVAISNHADFHGTLDYVKATGAKYVVTDNSRGGKGYELALEIRSRLGIEACPSANHESREWGEG